MRKERKIRIEENDVARGIIEKMAKECSTSAAEYGYPSQGGAGGFINTEEGEVRLFYGYYADCVDKSRQDEAFVVEIGDTKVEFEVHGLILIPYKDSEAEEVEKALEILRNLKPDDIVFPHKEKADK